MNIRKMDEKVSKMTEKFYRYREHLVSGLVRENNLIGSKIAPTYAGAFIRYNAFIISAVVLGLFML